jgi:hypothetical protein
MSASCLSRRSTVPSIERSANRILGTHKRTIADIRDRVERALERIEPSPTAFGDTMRRTRRRQRNRRASAGALGLFLTAAVVLGLWASMTEGRPEPATRTPTSAPIAMGDRLFLAGDGEAWVVDIERSAVHHLVLPELAPGDPDTRVVRRGDVLVAWGMSGPVILDPSNNFASRPLVEGDGRLFLPSARDERVWI